MATVTLVLTKPSNWWKFTLRGIKSDLVSSDANGQCWANTVTWYIAYSKIRKPEQLPSAERTNHSHWSYAANWKKTSKL